MQPTMCPYPKSNKDSPNVVRSHTYTGSLPYATPCWWLVRDLKLHFGLKLFEAYPINLKLVPLPVIGSKYNN